MYPQGDGNRRRRVGPPPGQMAPQHSPHMIGMTQQAPGVMLPVRNPPVQILQQNQHHYPGPQYPSAQSVNPNQQYAPAPVPAPFRTHVQTQPLYSHNNTQVVLTNQAVNHNKHYREDYKVIKENPPAEPSLNNYQSYSQQNYNEPLSLNQKDNSEEERNMANPLPVEPEKADPRTDESSHATDSPNKDVTSCAGIKEKTPMCLVNELARFNKITHQYRLTQEQGPAHKKSFTVTLTLGEEEYTAEGQSIKKAQHAAAGEALRKTVYPHPTPKNNKFLPIGKGNMTPTVELNALAMKRGEPAIYKIVEFPSGHGFQSQANYGYRRPLGMRGGYYGRGRGSNDGRNNRFPPRNNYPNYNAYGVTLKVGDKEFVGEGNTPQLARHDAASKALAHLRLLPQPENVEEIENTNDALGDQDLDSSIKSPISLVHEIALKRNFNVLFNVLSEKGPPHMKTFVTQCVVGEIKCEGEGNGKKISKKRAAENMLQELKKLPPLSPSLTCSISMSRLKRKAPQTKKKTRNLIKVTQEPKPEVEVAEEMNPISRLIQIQQVKKEREPVYTLLEEKGMHRRREFIMEVAIGQLKATGSGPNKKVAKKNAAQSLLNLIEIPASATSPSATNVKEVAKPKQSSPSGSGGRQLAPGILLVNDQSKSPVTENEAASVKTDSANGPPGVKVYPKGFGPKEQLLYLSQVLNFEVMFSDYPKASHREHLTLVSMSTDPPQVCHGSAATIEEAHNEAAATALRALAEMGLDCSSTATDKNKSSPTST